MMRISLICLLSLVLLSCDPEKPVPVSNFSEKQLVVDGFFTDELKQHEISVSLVNNIGDSTLVPVESFDLKLSTTSQQYPFSLVGGTKVVSQSAFSGIPFENYELQFCYEGVCYKKDIEMPVQSVINSFEVTTDYVDTSGAGQLNSLKLSLSVAKSQYVRYELFWMDIVGSDTNWVLMPQPIYWTTQVLQGTYDYQLNERHNEYHNLDEKDGFKIKVYSLSNTTAEYLKKIESFSQSEFTGSQYQNPPYFYPGRVHGVVYGTVVDSAEYYF